MPHSGSDLDRFLRRVHRRYVALRGGGVGAGRTGGVWRRAGPAGAALGEGRAALGPSAAAIAFGRASDWRGESPAGRDCSMPRRKPTGNSGWPISWHRAHRRHLLVNDQPDPWAASVLAVAEARCRTLGPSAVVLNRLGARAGAASGWRRPCCLTLALLAGSPADTRPARAITSDRTAGQ